MEGKSIPCQIREDMWWELTPIIPHKQNQMVQIKIRVYNFEFQKSNSIRTNQSWTGMYYSSTIQERIKG